MLGLQSASSAALPEAAVFLQVLKLSRNVCVRKYMWISSCDTVQHACLCACPAYVTLYRHRSPQGPVNTLDYRLHNRELFAAARAADLSSVRAALAGGANPNARGGKDATTPLIAAARKGATEIVQALLAARAKPDLANGNGDTALMAAGRETHLPMQQCAVRVSTQRSSSKAHYASLIASRHLLAHSCLVGLARINLAGGKSQPKTVPFC